MEGAQGGPNGVPKLLLSILTWASLWGLFEMSVVLVAKQCHNTRALVYVSILAGVAAAYVTWPHLQS